MIGGPRPTAFRGAVTTLSRDKTLLHGIDAMFCKLGDTGAGSRVSTLDHRLSPLRSGRDSSVTLGRGLFTHVGTICRGPNSLSGRRGGLLRRACGSFMHKNTGLSTRDRGGLHRLGDRVSVLRLAFNRGVRGRAGTFRLVISGRRSLTKLPRGLVTDTTRATGRTNVRNG